MCGPPNHLSGIEKRYVNDETGAPAHDPAVQAALSEPLQLSRSICAALS